MSNVELVRRDVVERLVEGATRGMLSSVSDCTSNEVLSAYFTLLRRAMSVCLLSSPSPITRAAFQHTLMQLVAECCADSTQRN